MINTIMMSDNLYKATHIGNRFGISAVLFNRIMYDAKVIRKVSGVWTLRSKYTTTTEPYAVLREERKAHSPEKETVMSFVTRAKDRLMISSPKYIHRFGSVSEYERTMFLDGLEDLYKVKVVN